MLEEAVALTLSHDLVYLAVLLSADKLLVLVGKLDLHTHLILAALDKRNLVDHHHPCLDCIVGSVDGEGQVVKANLRLGVGTDIGQHGTDVGGRGGPEATLGGIRHDDPPRGTVELTSLYFKKKKKGLVLLPPRLRKETF